MTWMRPPARNPQPAPARSATSRPPGRWSAAGRCRWRRPRGSLDTPRPGSTRDDATVRDGDADTWRSRHANGIRSPCAPSCQPGRDGPLVTSVAILTYPVRWRPWGGPEPWAIPDQTDCSGPQGRGQAPERSGLRFKALGGLSVPEPCRIQRFAVALTSYAPQTIMGCTTGAARPSWRGPA
jgi:hypothetical protein